MSIRALLAADGIDEAALSPATKAGLAVCVVLVICIAGIMSGLTLGLLTLDRLDLELMVRTGTKQQHKFARRLMPMVNNPHWVLSTLVICNTAAGMALPLCLDRLVNVAVALVLSTTAIVLFGEILPQAVCSRYGLSIGGHAAPVVRFLMFATAPLSWPIGKALDALLGKENFTFGKRQIRALVHLHRESTGLGGPLNEEEFHVIQGMLDLGRKKGLKAMTPLENVFMLSTDDIIDRPTLRRILESGHSRLPVYRGSNRLNIIGLILVKELLAVVGLAEPGSGPVPVMSLRMRDLPALSVDTPMTDLLNLFQTGHSHMALLLQQAGAKSSGGSRRVSSTRRSTASGSLHAASRHSSSSSSDSDDVSSSRSSSFSSSSSSNSGSSSRSFGSGDTGSPRSPRSPSKAGRMASTFLQCLSSKKFRSGSLKVTAHDDDEASAQHNQQQQQSSDTNADAAAQAAGVAVSQDQQLPDVANPAGAGAVVIEMRTLPLTTTPTVAAAVHAATVEAAGASPTASAPLPSSALWTIPVNPAPPAPAAAAALPAAAPAKLYAASADSGVPSAAAASHAAAAAGIVGAAAAKDSSKHGGLFPSVCGPMVPVGIITLEDVLEELMQEEIVDETDNEPINTRVLTMSLSPGMRRLLLASQQRMAAAILDPRSAAAGPAQAPTGAAGASSSSSAAHAAPAPQAGVQNP